MTSRNWLPVALCSVFLSQTVNAPMSAAPKPAPVSAEWLKEKGAKKEGPIGPAMLWLDEATKARGSAHGGGAASVGSAEALIFHQPNDSGFGFFEKTYDLSSLPTWACRMKFGNGFEPGDSISSYELTIFHSSSDDINFGDADYAVELWDGDPMSILETVCTIGGVSAPIPGTQGIIADVPYATQIRARIELPAKVVYDCDRVWMAMRSLNGCRATWRISGFPLNSFSAPPVVGSGNGISLITGCESSSLGGVCPTDTGLGVGFCCGSEGTCSGSGGLCRFESDCPIGETCDGQELCDHGSDAAPVLCNSTAAAEATFCGDGSAAYYFANVGLPDTEQGYVGTIFAATEKFYSVVPVSVDAPPNGGSLPAGVISLGGNEVVLASGGHDIWLELRISDWDPDDVGDAIAGLHSHFDSASLTSGLQGAIDFNVGPQPCGECSDNAAPCYSDEGCTIGTCTKKRCSDDGEECVIDSDCATGNCEDVPCHRSPDCHSGETCDGAPAVCWAKATGDDECAAALGTGATCGPPAYYLGSGTCAFAYMDTSRPDWALTGAQNVIIAVGLANPDFVLGAAVSAGPALPDPEPFPDDLLYAGTFSLSVPSDAKGTFTIDMQPPPFSTFPSGAGPHIPLVGVVPGFITIPTGRCCYNLQDFPTGGEGCIDLLQTAGTCAQQPGQTHFKANADCDDACFLPECFATSAPGPDVVPGASDNWVTSVKNRFISFAPTTVGIDFPIIEAARVTFVSLPRPFDLWNGHQLWVTSPVEVNESGASVEPVEGLPSFYAATLTCDGPVFADFTLGGMTHVFHEGIVPGGTYRIELLGQFCSPDSPEGFSPPLEITNSKWGDVLGGFETTPPSAPEGTNRLVDILGVLARFSNAPGAIVKARADMEPGCLDLTINISDAIAALTGYQGLPYQFAPTAGNPCASTCVNPLP